MGDFTQVRFTREGPRATLTFARPASLNALSPTLIAEALAVAEQVAASDARVLVVEGEGKSFSAGVDLKAVTAPGAAVRNHAAGDHRPRHRPLLHGWA